MERAESSAGVYSEEVFTKIRCTSNWKYGNGNQYSTDIQTDIDKTASCRNRDIYVESTIARQYSLLSNPESFFLQIVDCLQQ